MNGPCLKICSVSSIIMGCIDIHRVNVDCLAIIFEYLSDPNDILRLYATGDSVFIRQLAAVEFRNVHLKLEPFYPVDIINRILINHPIRTLSICLDRYELLHPLKFASNNALIDFPMHQLNSLELKLFNSFNFTNFDFNNHFPNLKNLSIQVAYSPKLFVQPSSWSALLSTCKLPNHLDSLSWVMDDPILRFGNAKLQLFNDFTKWLPQSVRIVGCAGLKLRPSDTDGEIETWPPNITSISRISVTCLQFISRLPKDVYSVQCGLFDHGQAAERKRFNTSSLPHNIKELRIFGASPILYVDADLPSDMKICDVTYWEFATSYNRPLPMSLEEVRSLSVNPSATKEDERILCLKRLKQLRTRLLPIPRDLDVRDYDVNISRMLNDFTNLRELYTYEDHFFRFSAETLSSVEYLQLEISMNPRSIHDRSAHYMSHHLPSYLTTLDLIATSSFGMKPTALPNTAWESLPPTLTTFHASLELFQNSTSLSYLPHSISKILLELKDYAYDNAEVDQNLRWSGLGLYLPRNLKNISVFVNGYHKCIDNWMKEMQQGSNPICYNRLCLRFNRGQSINLEESVSEILLDVAKSCTSLDLDPCVLPQNTGGTGRIFSQLPPNLKYLKLTMRHATATCGESYVLQREDIESLPRSIETLHLCNCNFIIKPWEAPGGWMSWHSLPPNIGSITFDELGGRSSPSYEYHKDKKWYGCFQDDWINQNL